jgi:phosphatidylserine/phosphatidylglycerophosphate/cardiolipin synthase-like enzyme
MICLKLGSKGLNQALFGVLGLLISQLAFAYPVEMASSPESNLGLTLSAINSAKQSLLVNIYELSSPEIVQAITDQIGRGVHVEVLEEGQPVGGISAAARGMQASMVQAMNQAGNGDRLVEMTSKSANGKVKRRFHYDHAKYMVIDSSSLVVGSENYSPTGQPEPGTAGNRGWEVWVQYPELAQQFGQMFASDSDPQNQDITTLTSSSVSSAGASGLMFDSSRRPAPWQPFVPMPPSTAVGQADASQILPLSSPDSSQAGLINLINSAQSSLMIEQMTLAPTWKTSGNSASSPLVDAILAAARRGVHVSVLLNDERVFAHGGKVSTKNTDSVAAFNQAATSESLPIEARIANLRAMGVTYIHNKGALVDGQVTLISSINWDQNSIQNNRETALLLTSPEIYNFYLATFQSDWSNSAVNGDGSGVGDPGSESPDPVDGDYQTDDLKSFTTAMVMPVDDMMGDSIGDGELSSQNCPQAVDASIVIGDIALLSPVDPSFRALQGSQFQASFLPLQGGDCSFRSDTNAGPLFLQFRSHGTDGAMLVIVEGYTPAGKIFSIRAVKSQSSSGNVLKASVYDSSAGRPVRIGEAQMSLSFM